ncbi:MAG: MFS transporter [Dehalococcoidia bacterium]|nr:MFS transporter [Dehalococcoidia bacterium]
MLARLMPRVYEGWVVVGAAAFIVTMIGAVFFYGFGTIFNPLRAEFGWSATATSLAFSLRQETSGIASPFIGMAIDRWGSRVVLLCGLMLVSLGVVAMSMMTNLWQFYAVMTLIAVGTSASGGQVGLVAIATWFEERRARAMSVMTVGGGIAGLLVVGVAALVESLGWRGALQALAAMIVVVGGLAALNVRSRPANHPQPIDGIACVARPGGAPPYEDWGVPLSKAVRSRSYLVFTYSILANGFATTALIVLQIPFFESLGVSKTLAGTSVAVFTLVSITGRLGAGVLADRFPKRYVLAASVGMVGAGMPLLALTHSFWPAMAVMVLIAPGFGGAIPVRPAMLADYFGTRYFGTLNGISALITTFGGFGSPLLVGWLVDTTDSYSVGWIICGLIGLTAVPAALASRPPHALLETYQTSRPPRLDEAAAGS